MSFRAFWPILNPDSPADGATMTVTTGAEVAMFVSRLAEPHADTAVIYHDQRTCDPDGLPDHYLHAVVHDGYGYLSYFDTDSGLSFSDGQPGTPGYLSENEDWEPGRGLPIDDLAAALTEFLKSAERPTSTTWTD